MLIKLGIKELQCDKLYAHLIKKYITETEPGLKGSPQRRVYG